MEEKYNNKIEMKKRKSRLVPEALSLKVLRGTTRILREYSEFDTGIKPPYR
jgi:hypothetical protein